MPSSNIPTHPLASPTVSGQLEELGNKIYGMQGICSYTAVEPRHKKGMYA